jgi:DHA2 family multidrug resistance protein
LPWGHCAGENSFGSRSIKFCTHCRNGEPWQQCSNNAIAGFNAAGISTEQALSQINRMVDQQAYMLAADDIFYDSTVVFLLLIPVVWLSRPIRAGSTGKAGGAPSADAAAGAH